MTTNVIVSIWSVWVIERKLKLDYQPIIYTFICRYYSTGSYRLLTITLMASIIKNQPRINLSTSLNECYLKYSSVLETLHVL